MKLILSLLIASIAISNYYGFNWLPNNFYVTADKPQGRGPPGHNGNGRGPPQGRGPPGQNSNGPPGHNDNGPPGHNGNGPPGHNGNGPPGHNDNGPPGHNSNGPPGHNNNGPPGHNGNGPPGHNGNGPPDHNGNGPPGHNGNGPPGHNVDSSGGHIPPGQSKFKYNSAWKREENANRQWSKPKKQFKKSEKHAKPHKPKNKHFQNFYNIYNSLETSKDEENTSAENEIESTNDDFDGRSVVAPGQYPHMAAIGFPATDNRVEYKCGGSLISYTYVVTAAHCCSLSGDTPVIVKLGIINLKDENADNFIPQERQISEVFVHPLYKTTQNYHDIALLELQDPIERSKFVRPIRLWVSDIVPYAHVFTMGYGSTSFAKAPSHILTEMELSAVPQDECNNALQQDESTPEGVTDTQICAKDYVRHRDTCQGDSGGPLQLNLLRSKKPGFRFYLVGIISYGEVCGGGSPGVYTKLSSYVDWIASIVWPDDFQNF